MLRTKKTAATPAKKVWRISESAPMGEWVSEATPVAPKPSKDVPEVAQGPWVRSASDLLDGSDVTEDLDTLPSDLFDELFPPKQDTPKNSEK